jgi:hypothetical protein
MSDTIEYTKSFDLVYSLRVVPATILLTSEIAGRNRGQSVCNFPIASTDLPHCHIMSDVDHSNYYSELEYRIANFLGQNGLWLISEYI